jgi:5-methylthioadenosine/S-adenosylhomocysteine deaminase
MAITHFSNVDWIVAWDAEHEGHSYLKGGDLAFDGNAISFIGKNYTGPADTVIDGTGLCLIPGLVDIHAHPATEVFYRGLREDHSVPEHYMTGLYERSCAYSAHIDRALLPVGAEASYAELMLSGVTTLVDITAPYPGWIDVMARSGLRMFAAPTFETSRWTRDNIHQLKFIEDIPKGEQGFRAAMDVIDEARAHPSGRLDGIVSPSTIDKVTPELLIESRAEASTRDLPWTTHTSQSVLEFNLMVERHGISPIQFLAENDLLGEGVILGHAIVPDHSSWVGWHSNLDVELLGETATGVAHCPTPFMRYGTTLESFGRYLDAGVVLGIGTDTIPHNFIEDMRSAAILARVAEHDGNTAKTGDVFHAGTAGGAKALMQDDIGRLAVGAKADIVVIDCNHPMMLPSRDPLMCLIHSAADRAVKDVYIDGVQTVRDHECLTLDRQTAAEQIIDGQARMEAAVEGTDFLGRTSQEIAPLSLPMSNGG